MEDEVVKYKITVYDVGSGSFFTLYDEYPADYDEANIEDEVMLNVAVSVERFDY